MPNLINYIKALLPRQLRSWQPVQASTKLLSTAVSYIAYAHEFYKFWRLSGGENGRLQCRWRDRLPVMLDNTTTTSFDRHYVYHCAWAVRVLSQLRPERHVDISSSLYFASIVSAFIPIDFYDYRPSALSLSCLNTGKADLISLHFPDRSIPSISCMHVVEHIGLGRYGDSIDPDGDLKAISELQRVLAVGGSLLYVVPVGRPRVCFNAHRIYSYHQVRNQFSGLRLVQFALIPDSETHGGLIVDADESIADQQEYGCGCFWFQRTQ